MKNMNAHLSEERKIKKRKLLMEEYKLGLWSLVQYRQKVEELEDAAPEVSILLTRATMHRCTPEACVDSHSSIRKVCVDSHISIGQVCMHTSRCIHSHHTQHSISEHVH